MPSESDYIKGRGAQFNAHNPFDSNRLTDEHIEGMDEPIDPSGRTEIIQVYPKTILNPVKSPDIPHNWSMNPYQGCEHGCIYCYARPTHNYWGYSAGLDFERKIMVKANAAELLDKELRKQSWRPEPIMLSGNTDCYQPIEKQLEITRSLLKVLVKFRQPVGIITKNSLLLRDLDLLRELNEHDLVQVAVSITTLDEKLRSILEPRTATAKKRIEVVKTLADEGIPVMAMMAPIIPGLTSHEIPAVIEAVANAGAWNASYTLVRLNGPLPELFADWMHANFPDRAEKVLNQVASIHGGSLGDARFGTRMRGEGQLAAQIRDLFRISKQKHLNGRKAKPYNLEAFRVPEKGQLRLF